MRARRVAAAAAAATIVTGLTLAILATLPHRYYLPSIGHNCNQTFSLAWTPGNLVDQARREFCAPLVFHSGCESRGWLARGDCVPVVHNWEDASTILKDAGDYCARGGLVKVLNEPDLASGKTPAMSVATYEAAIAAQPGCRFIWPNAVSVDYLDQVLQLRRPRPGDVIGYHIYDMRDSGGRPVLWPAVRDAEVAGVLVARGVKNERMVSEVGPSNDWSIDDLRRYYGELDRLPVARVFVYTPHCGGWSPGACRLNLYTDEAGSDFTRSGRVLREVVFGLPAAYP